MTGPEILDQAFALLMVMARIGVTFAVLPGLGESTIPARIKAGLILIVTILLLPVLAPLLPSRPREEPALALMLLTEMANGLWFGWLARTLTISLPAAGQFIADVSGLSNVLLPSPELGAQTSAVSRLYELSVPVLVLSAGLHQPLLAALVGFYQLVPPGHLPNASDGGAATLAAVALGFDLALRLAAPFILTSIIWNVAIGLTARLVPRLQVFFVAMPGQIGLGLVLLTVLAAPLLAAWMQAMRIALPALPAPG